MKKALLIIDLQKDYFPDGLYPLWDTGRVLENIVSAIGLAQKQGIEVIHIQHIANPGLGLSPFFNKDTEGAEIVPEVMAAAPDAPVVRKEYIDAFFKTTLEDVLAERQVDELLVCGMMTQNCVTHTAISKSAEKYKVTMLADCCTTVTEILHQVGLFAVSTRLDLADYRDAMKAE